MQNHTFQLVLKSKPYTIPTIFKHTIDMSPEIYNYLIFDVNHSYHVKSNVTDEIFQSFINYLINDEEPEVAIENFNQYQELSKEFHVLNSFLSDKKQFFGEFLVNLNAIHQQNNQDKADYETDIAKNLDEYLQNHGEYLMKSPIQSLYNIFNHKDRNLTDHNLAYELIEKNFETNNDSNIFVLLDSLDGTKLSKSNLSRAFSMKNDRFNHMPKIEFNFLANAIAREIEFKNQLTSLSNEFTEYKNKSEIFLKKIESEQEERIKNIEEKHRVEILGLKNQIKQNEEKINKIFDEEKKKHKEEIDELNKKIKQNEEKINELINSISKQEENEKKETEKLASLIKENEESQNKAIDILKKKIDENDSKNASINKNVEQNSQNINEIQQKIENFLYVKPDLESKGILNLLKMKEKTKFDRLFVASLSSCDIYNIIDPKTKDAFCTSADQLFFIEFELKKAITFTGAKIYSSYKYFPKSFDIEIDNEKVFSTKEATDLNGTDKEMIIKFDPVRSKKVRFIRTGPNWDKNTSYVLIKRIELLSNEKKYSEGVFKTLVESSENQDPHKSQVYISSTWYDLNSFYLLDPEINITTLNKENSWIQIELTQGFALITGYRIKRGSIFKTINYKIVCSNNVNEPMENWTVLMEIHEKKETQKQENDIYLLNGPSSPVKYIRLVQIGPNSRNNFFLKFWNFDIYGYYI